MDPRSHNGSESVNAKVNKRESKRIFKKIKNFQKKNIKKKQDGNMGE